MVGMAFLAWTTGVSAAPKLKVGDAAPKMMSGKWIQGEPVASFDKERVYLVEFWATWCGPCRTSIPHLNEIHQKYKDRGLVVIGQDVLEEDAADSVRAFVKEMGNKMTYRVALDDTNGNEDGKMNSAWMKAAERKGIPSAFLVGKDGNIAWIGHPMELKESTIEQALEGTLDLKKAASDYTASLERETKMAELIPNFNAAASKGEWEKAFAVLDDIEKITPDDQRTDVDAMRLRLTLKKQDNPASVALAKKLAEKNNENARFLDSLAWMIVTEDNPAKELVEAAAKISDRANELTKGEHADVLDTLARVKFLAGDKTAAIAASEKAAARAEGPAKKAYTKNLEAYKAGKLPE